MCLAIVFFAVTVDTLAHVIPQIHKPLPYSFGYTIKDKHGEQHREETGDGVGHVKGSYGFTNERGIHREVHYVADKAGFRAEVKTNEHGTAPLNPAAVKMISSAHPYLGGAGLGKISAAATSLAIPAIVPELAKAPLDVYGGPLFGGAVTGYDSRFGAFQKFTTLI